MDKCEIDGQRSRAAGTGNYITVLISLVAHHGCPLTDTASGQPYNGANARAQSAWNPNGLILTPSNSCGSNSKSVNTRSKWSTVTVKFRVMVLTAIGRRN
jgi:hypothetical protein